MNIDVILKFIRLPGPYAAGLAIAVYFLKPQAVVMLGDTDAKVRLLGHIINVAWPLSLAVVGISIFGFLSTKVRESFEAKAKAERDRYQRQAEESVVRDRTTTAKNILCWVLIVQRHSQGPKNLRVDDGKKAALEELFGAGLIEAPNYPFESFGTVAIKVTWNLWDFLQRKGADLLFSGAQLPEIDRDTFEKSRAAGRFIAPSDDTDETPPASS